MYTGTDADECMCIPTLSRENDLVAQHNSNYCCIPNYIPEFPSDIPVQCGGNLQCGCFTDGEAVLKQGEMVKGQISYKVRKIRVYMSHSERETEWDTVKSE